MIPKIPELYKNKYVGCNWWLYLEAGQVCFSTLYPPLT